MIGKGYIEVNELCEIPMDYILYLYSAQTQKNLNLHIKTDPVMAGADATVYMSWFCLQYTVQCTYLALNQTYSVASAPIGTVLVFIYAKNLII